MAFLRVAAVSSRVRVNFSAVESKVFCKTFSAQPISRSIHMFLTKNIKSRVLPETCSLYQISSGKGGQWSFCHDLMRTFFSIWNLGEKNKGVDAGAVGLVHWDRDVQEAVSPPHLHKTLSRNGILKLLAGDCLHAPTWMFLHLDTQHLDILHLDVSSHLNVLQAFASQLAAQSLCQLVAKVSRAP